MATAATTTRRLNGNGQAAPRTVAPSEARIALQPIEQRKFKVTVEGMAPLVTHKVSAAALASIAAKQQQKAAAPRAARDPHAEYLSGLYVMPGGTAGEPGTKYGLPAAAFKRCAVDACGFAKSLRVPKTIARGAFYVLEHAAGLVEIRYEGLRMREDTVRLESGTLDIRYRPEFTGWSCELEILYNATNISAEQITNLLEIGGFSVGVGDNRPQAKKGGAGGSNGLFRVRLSK